MMKKLIFIISLVLISFLDVSAASEVVKEHTLADRMKFFLILVPASLWDSINPCAFAAMIILLTAVLKQQKGRSRVLLAWFMFILSIFISYTAMGIWLYKALATTDSTFYLKLVVWIIWVLVWLANLKDYFWYGKWFTMEVPMSWRKKMRQMLKKVVSPGWAFAVWFLISLFLLPCTSWPYITILWYLAAESSEINTWWYIYILIYNIIFVLPMVVIALVMWLGIKWTEELNELKELNVERIHLITWIIMLLLWIYILTDIFFLSV